MFIAKPSRRLGNQRVATINLWRSPSFTLLLPFVHGSLICLRQQSVGLRGGRTDDVGNKSLTASDLGAILLATSSEPADWKCHERLS